MTTTAVEAPADGWLEEQFGPFAFRLRVAVDVGGLSPGPAYGSAPGIGA